METMDAKKLTEQRWSQRRPISLGIEVLVCDELIVACNSRDVGLGGVFLETDTHRLMEGQDVDLRFSLGEANLTKHTLKATVVHVLGAGAGLKFKNFDTNSFSALQEIMKHSSPVYA